MVRVPNEGKLFLLDQLLRTDAVEIGPFTLRLFRTAVTIGDGTVRADMVEANYDGYLPVVMERADWSAAIVSSDTAQSSWGAGLLTFFTDSGTQDVYGWFVTDQDDNFLLWGENFPLPITVSTSVPVTLFPVMRLDEIV